MPMAWHLESFMTEQSKDTPLGLVIYPGASLREVKKISWQFLIGFCSAACQLPADRLCSKFKKIFRMTASIS